MRELQYTNGGVETRESVRDIPNSQVGLSMV